MKCDLTVSWYQGKIQTNIWKLHAGKLPRWQNDDKWFLLFLGQGFDLISPWRGRRERRYNKDKMIMASQWNNILVANFESQKSVFKTLNRVRTYKKKIFRNMRFFSRSYFEKHKLSARHWSLLTTIIYERLYKLSKGHSYHQWGKYVIYVLTLKQKLIRNFPVIIKQIKKYPSKDRLK